MKEPKEASAPVDAERVVHELLDALETLAKKRQPLPPLLANRRGKLPNRARSKANVVPGESEQHKSRHSKAPGVQRPQASRLNQARTESSRDFAAFMESSSASA